MVFLSEKEKAVKKKTRHEKHTQMGFELLTSSWRSRMYQLVHSVHYTSTSTSILSATTIFSQVQLSRQHWVHWVHRPQTADLENTDLENTDLENADLENADLENADSENADLENVVYFSKTQLTSKTQTSKTQTLKMLPL